MANHPSTSDLVMSDTEGPSQSDLGSKAAIFQAMIDKGREAVGRKDLSGAVEIYSELIRLDSENHVLFSNRSAILAHLGRYQDALADAHHALQLLPTWTKGYYRAGQALGGMGDWVGALRAFASGLAQDPPNPQLLTALVHAASASNLRERFEAAYGELSSLSLEKSPFVLVSVVGQELLAAGFNRQAAEVLECALKIGTTSMKLKQSVLSSLSSAYWSLAERDKALDCMQADLSVARALGDLEGEATAQGNLGMVFMSVGKEAEALGAYREQLGLAQRLGKEEMARGALGKVAAVLLSLGDTAAALAAHHQALALLQAHRSAHQSAGHAAEMGRALEGLGAVHLARGELEAGEDCFLRLRGLATRRSDRPLEARALLGLGDLEERRGKRDAALAHFQDALRLAKSVSTSSDASAASPPAAPTAPWRPAPSSASGTSRSAEGSGTPPSPTSRTP